VLVKNSNFDDRAYERYVARGYQPALLGACVGRIGALLLSSNLVGSFVNSREFLYDV
jgi:hypothetical protein